MESRRAKSRTGKDLFVLDAEPTPDGAVLHSVADDTVSPSEHKQGAAANLDDDLYDEVVYLTQPFDQTTGRGTTGTLQVLDYDGSAFSTETLDADLSPTCSPWGASAGPRNRPSPW